MIKIKRTPLSVVLVALEVVLLLVAFYYLAIENNHGMALAGVIALIAALLNGLLIAVQQLIAYSTAVNKKVLWTVEILLIVAGVVYVAVNGISIG